MRARLTVLAIASASMILTLGVGGSALAAAPVGAAAAPGAVDSTFMAKNAQTDLAEITIGKIAQSRGQSAAAKDLAEKTMSDHVSALAKLKTLAASMSVTLPTAPNAAQMADAAKLQSVSVDQFDLTYAQVQIAGHQLSIADTNTELASGTNAATKDYAGGYLPVAQMHLTMAQDLLSSVGGSNPTAVPAGTGGMGATTSAAARTAQLVIGALGLLLIAFAATVTTRRRRLS